MIIAIDPGGTSGIAMREHDDSLSYIQLHKPGEVYEFLWRMLGSWKGEIVEAIVCENFTTAGRISKDGLHTVRIIGGVQAIGIIKGVPVYTPEPSQRKMCKDEAERLAPKGYELRHQRDALMHLLAYEYRKSQGRYGS